MKFGIIYEPSEPYCKWHINCWSSNPICPWCLECKPPTPDSHIMGVKNQGAIVRTDGTAEGTTVEDTSEWYTFADFKKDHPEWYEPKLALTLNLLRGGGSIDTYVFSGCEVIDHQFPGENS